MQDVARRGVVWPVLLVVAATALTSSVMVATSTASANLDGPRGRSEHLRATTSDHGRAVLTMPGMIPGQVVEHCITVTAEGAMSAQSELRVYGRPSGDLVDHLGLTVGTGSIGSTCSAPGEVARVFSGRVADFGRDFATGSRIQAAPTAGATIAVVVAVSLGANTPDSAQGMGADLELIWEVRGGSAPH